ncbi:hypothetical protein OsJ_18882 [Oryza sativa Japonica Group]|uniref:Uncharacterized protein n=1 Tax=Oryza sativa subsp. japonica TaxID=39947 RepID=B9FJP7_ORYSJ|nr:hypothetical protein OsJ_18882 [Oryza sativa Japonica Group]
MQLVHERVAPPPAAELAGRRGGGGGEGMEIVTARVGGCGYGYEEEGGTRRQQRRRRKVNDGHVVAQLLGFAAPDAAAVLLRVVVGGGDPRAAPRGAVVVAPPGRRRRRHRCRRSGRTCRSRGRAPPACPRTPRAAEKVVREVLPPRPQPGRAGGRGGSPAHAHARAYFGNATETTSSDDDDSDDTFSDALDRISASDRFAAFSSRLSSIDGAGSLRLPSFIMDRFLPAANAIATTSADKRPKKTPRRGARSSKQDEEATASARRRAQSLRRASGREQPKQPPPRHHVSTLQRKESEPPPPPRQSRDIDEETQSDEMSPRSCGFMLFLPWSVKPVLCGFARSRTSRAADASTTASSPPRRSVTLGNALEKEKEKEKDKSKLRGGGGDPSRWSDEKSGSGREWSSPGWGTAILGTSKRYCADARKALSRLARSRRTAVAAPRVTRGEEGRQAGGGGLAAALDVRRDPAVVAAVRVMAQSRAREQHTE